MADGSGVDIQEDVPVSDFSKYLLDRVRQLEERNVRLKEEYRKIELEKKSVENKKVQYERENRKLTAELDRLKTPPLLVGTVVDVMANNKLVIKSSSGPKFVVNSSQFINSKDIFPGAKVALNQQSLAVIEVLPPVKDPMVLGMEVIEAPNIDYQNIGGLEDQINEIKETVELPLLKPELFEKVGIQPPKGVLLYGPPGTGKTLLAKAVAHSTKASFIRIIGSELVQKYIGEGARMVRELFELAKEKSPSIIFIDEIDSIGAKRLDSITSGDREVQRTLVQLLAEMDGFDPRGNVRILAATNRPDILDPALLRPGRFDRIIKVPMPNAEARTEILKIHARRMNLADDVNLKKIGQMTDDTSGADLSAIVMEAGMFAIRGNRDIVTNDDFTQAMQKVLGERNKNLTEMNMTVFA
ncbi:proteasome-activating nucleotidase [Methanocella paludicola SANAE]|uniref:Proteasome-activating nucleotidase n=1 Tax=Methanocella paludicola (strain DSM 17711 / JCM 13418 / NBRC 101707 / SANAE) TaxID=304371 RepID=D1YXA2_METPS|nr:proteasome-activating nucleotidase [Methanocella paludicola]BAI61074.1 proteasome-activating nucleotidase [Methanocella paludicola SANAE]